MTMPRVLFVTNMYPSPGAPASGIFVEQQIEGLRRAGVQPEVLFVDRRNEGRRAYGGLQRRLKMAIAAQPADLVHVMYGGVMAERATRDAGLPVVVTFHGSDLQGSAGAGPVDRLSAAYGVLCSRKAALRADGVVIVAPHLAGRLPAGIPSDRVRVIPCGIDLERFRPRDTAESRRSLGWAPDRFHVLFATNNDDPVKRPELAREAVRRLALGSRAQGQTPELHFLRGVPNEEVPVWLSAADVLLLTSYQEGSPTIVKEAMACERPIVSVAVGDVASQLEGVRGCHVTEADAGALADALRRVLEAGGPRTVDTRTRVAGQSLEATARRLLDFYEWVLASRPGRLPAAPWNAEAPVSSATGAP